jgi:hypothetical protein
MFVVKNSIMSVAGMLGGVFGYVSAPTEMLAFVAAFGCMLACACVADVLTERLEENEDGDD